MSQTCTYQLLGWADESAGPTLALDHTEFAYAGKFRMSRTGKAVARDTAVVGAASFNTDRGCDNALRIRYITVREDRRGERIGPRLAAFVRTRAVKRGYTRVRIAVNNPVAYDALYRAGFGYTGEQRGLAELVLEAPSGQPTAAYHDGLAVFADRSLPDSQRQVLERGQTRGPPEQVTSPTET